MTHFKDNITAIKAYKCTPTSIHLLHFEYVNSKNEWVYLVY